MWTRRRYRNLVILAACLCFAAGALTRIGERCGDYLWDTRYAPITTPTTGMSP